MSGVRRVRVIGAGGHAKVVVRALLDLGYTIEAVFDDDPARWGTRLLGNPVVGPVSRIAGDLGCPAVIAVGDNAARRRLAGLYDLPWITVVHPTAWVDPSVQLGRGTVVLQRAVIQPDSQLGMHGIINTAATIDHDCSLGDFVHAAPGVHLAGAVTVDDDVLLGIGSVAVPGTSIGRTTIVGAGAVVTADLPAGVIAAGVPARVLRQLDSHPASGTPAAGGQQAEERRAPQAEFDHHGEHRQ